MGILDEDVFGELDFGNLVGQTITRVQEVTTNNGSDEILITLAPGPAIPNGLEIKQVHLQSCCEKVYVDEVVGDWQDIIDSPITLAEEVINRGSPKTTNYGDFSVTDESSTWTFYKLATVKGYVTIRWYGTSNGYYIAADGLV